MATLDFLVELGTAELPPTSLQKLSKAFTKGILEGIKSEFNRNSDLISQIEVQSYATPRRLAVKITALETQVPGAVNMVQGPPIKICYDADNNPTKALLGFAKKNNADLEDLEEVNGKISYSEQVPAKDLSQLLPAIVEESLAKLPIAKRMRWGANRIEFVRPVQWLLMIFGEQVIDCTILGAKSGRVTRGHRFHHPQDIIINTADQYEDTLHKAYVITDFSKRRALIEKQVNQQAEQINGCAQIDQDLLNEVTGLNEWPVALSGGFGKEFLSVPQEALILSMKEHQKYFHIVDDEGVLMPNFITISNIESKEPAKVVIGNEKVIRPRLADAKFFFDNDKKTTLESRTEKLKSIVFQQQLGTVYEKSERIASLASHIAALIDGDKDKANRAAKLAKTDLITDMVFEFTDLQGLMGYHYALNDGEDQEVAKAIYEQYLPKFSGDELPQTKTGISLALADRLDTLTGMFGIGQPPTGSKDPFALRRATLGVLRIIIEQNLNIDLKQLVSLAVEQHKVIESDKLDSIKDAVISFMLERLRAYYEDKGIRIDTYLAVAELKPTNPLDFDRRIEAVEHFRTLDVASALAAANKRVSNILDKQHTKADQDINIDLLSEASEKALYQHIVTLTETIAPLFEKNDYRGALTLLASLQQPIDQFFDDVMVMVEDPSIQQNRIMLLAKIRQLFLQIADISVLN